MEQHFGVVGRERPKEDGAMLFLGVMDFDALDEVFLQAGRGILKCFKGLSY